MFLLLILIVRNLKIMSALNAQRTSFSKREYALLSILFAMAIILRLELAPDALIVMFCKAQTAFKTRNTPLLTLIVPLGCKAFA